MRVPVEAFERIDGVEDVLSGHDDAVVGEDQRGGLLADVFFFSFQTRDNRICQVSAVSRRGRDDLDHAKLLGLFEHRADRLRRGAERQDVKRMGMNHPVDIWEIAVDAQVSFPFAREGRDCGNRDYVP